MKVLAVHNFHRKGSASGDDYVFENETQMMENHGIEVIRYSIQNDLFDDVGYLEKLRMALGMIWSFRHYRSVKKIIQQERPDIVHVHTFFPLLSPSILYAAKRNGCKVVATLHDTRFICPCATSLRGTEICNKCGDGHYFRMFKYKCFKNSRIQSAITAFIFWYHRKRKTFYNQIDHYICLNENQITLLTDIGFDKIKISKKYNFIPDSFAVEKIQEDKLPQRYVVFYGRIGEEKGIKILQKIWDRLCEIPLVVMGAGPLEKEFAVWAKNNPQVYYLGYTQHEKCLSIVKGGEFVVFPSIWYEGCSMVEIEAESLGKAIVATELGFSEEAIQNGVNGYKIPLGNITAFMEKIKELWIQPKLCKKMGRLARADYEAKFLPEDNYRQLIGIYASLLR